ncbi:MAG: DUF4440 domain-containing protein [Sphingomonas bacterium]
MSFLLFLALGATSPVEDKANVLATVEAVLAGVSARDEAAVHAHLRPTGTATVIMVGADGTTKVRNAALDAYAAATPGPEKYEERMIDPTVRVDGEMAMVRGRYTFAIDGKVRHCGYQHFDLVRDAGSWKIQNITWTVETVGCGGMGR